MKRIVVALVCGALFGIGLVLGGMTDPSVVLGFLDVFGAFDATLAFVLGGAVGVTLPAFALILRRHRPLLADAFRLPLATHVDAPLIAGAAVFGIGWGLAGYCPGPALVGAAGGVSSALLFVPAMLAGSLLHRMVATRRTR